MSYDKNGILISVSQVYKDVNEEKGPAWYDHKTFEPQWNSPDKYFIRKKAGRGKYSTVFQAVSNLHEECAIKVLVPLDPKRYLREIKILTNLKDKKNIVRLIDLVRDPQTGIYSFVFEWVDFIDWRSLYMTFNIDDIRLYMFKLLKALDVSHSCGIMHRDIKPQNVAIDKKTKKLRLLDWGLADFYHPQQKYNAHVATRVFKPPELLINYPYYDYSMDIWSAGLTFSIMMFRKIVIEVADNDSDQLYKVAELVGGKKIIKYARDIGIRLTDDQNRNLLSKAGTGWEQYISQAEQGLCPAEAIDLLKSMMIVDHRDRITAKGAMGHHFFDPLRATN